MFAQLIADRVMWMQFGLAGVGYRGPALAPISLMMTIVPVDSPDSANRWLFASNNYTVPIVQLHVNYISEQGMSSSGEPAYGMGAAWDPHLWQAPMLGEWARPLLSEVIFHGAENHFLLGTSHIGPVQKDELPIFTQVDQPDGSKQWQYSHSLTPNPVWSNLRASSYALKANSGGW